MARSGSFEHRQAPFIFLAALSQDGIFCVEHTQLSVHLLDLSHESLFCLLHRLGELMFLLFDFALKKVDSTNQLWLRLDGLAITEPERMHLNLLKL